MCCCLHTSTNTPPSPAKQELQTCGLQGHNSCQTRPYSSWPVLKLIFKQMCLNYTSLCPSTTCVDSECSQRWGYMDLQIDGASGDCIWEWERSVQITHASSTAETDYKNPLDLSWLSAPLISVLGYNQTKLCITLCHTHTPKHLSLSYALLWRC